MRDHEHHGRGTADAGPDYCDCPCRGTALQADCLRSGCGFCGAKSALMSMSDADVDAEISAAGGDPDAIAQRGERLARSLIANRAIEWLTRPDWPPGAELYCDTHGYYDGRKGCPGCKP